MKHIDCSQTSDSGRAINRRFRKKKAVQMALLKVLTWPDEMLRTVAKPVDQFGSELGQLIDDMFETMYAEKALDWRQRNWVLTVASWSIAVMKNANHMR